MVTDWVLIRRLAFEIEQRFRGAKVRDVGLLPDKRTAIALWNRGQTTLLCIDIFGTPPLVTVEDGELPIAAEPGFIRALGVTLRGMALLGAKARKGDRLIRMTFGARSRFGVGDEVELYIELVPRFGNIILTKRETIVTAAKEFSLAQNGTRAIQTGMAYQPPPARPQASLMPKSIAQAGGAISEPEALAYFESDAAMREPLYTYRRNGALLQAHVLELPNLEDAQPAPRKASLLSLLGEARNENAGGAERARTGARRAALRKRLADRAKRTESELATIAAKRAKAIDRETLRTQGETIYNTLYELDESARDEAKERALKLFSEYKKLGASLPHLDERERSLLTQREAIEALAWEVERAADEDLSDVEDAVAGIEPHRSTTAKAAKKRKRAPLEVRTPNGSRILVGRSPTENADLTFRVARPSDLWFHAQGIPGAHVIVQRDDRREPNDDDVMEAARLAARHSKAKTGTKVPIDYTERKHVRKQKDAPPGLVWYTDFKTIIVTAAQ